MFNSYVSLPEGTYYGDLANKNDAIIGIYVWRLRSGWIKIWNDGNCKGIHLYMAKLFSYFQVREWL